MQNLLETLTLPSPIQSFHFKEFPDKELLIKRDDLIHPLVSGNKWRKLKYNIDYALQEGYEGILSFGGAFSNHLFALSAACKMVGLKCKTIIRYTGLDPENPTMKFLVEQDAILSFMIGSAYRKAFSPGYIENIKSQFPRYHVIPEGGSNKLAIRGVQEIMEEVYQQIQHDKLLVICGVGSGSTITGIVKSLRPYDSAIGMVAVNDESLKEKIRSQLSVKENNRLSLDFNAHQGGFGKVSDSLMIFTNEFYKRTNIPIDPIYNGKVLQRVYRLLEKKELDGDYKILMIHTGGLQGNNGYNYRFPGKLDRGLLNR